LNEIDLLFAVDVRRRNRGSAGSAVVARKGKVEAAAEASAFFPNLFRSFLPDLK